MHASGHCPIRPETIMFQYHFYLVAESLVVNGDLEHILDPPTFSCVMKTLDNALETEGDRTPSTSPILAGSIILILVMRALVICRMSWTSL
jgi:hypothetical protein